MMSSRIEESKQLIKRSVNIQDVMAEDGIRLRPNGRELVGFHSNKHESKSQSSLSVNPTMQWYYCFNCGEGGDVITWLKRNRAMSFHEALSYLASKAGVLLPGFDPEEQERYEKFRNDRRELERLYTAAAGIYFNEVGTEESALLLSQWGLTAETVERFKIGYSPVNKHFIQNQLQSQGFVLRLKLYG